MSNNSHLKRAMLLTGLVAGFGVAKPASAMLVFDPITEGATTTTAVFTGIIMLKVKHMDSTLTHMSGTLDHISGTVDHISGNTDIIVGHQANIDGATNNISNQTDYNTYNKKEVNLITNNYYGGDNGIIPILSDANNGKFLGGNNDVNSYEDGYADAASYKDQIASNGSLTDASVEASKNLKDANDLLVETLNDHRASLRSQSQQIGALSSAATAAGSGTNDMLRYSNAVAAAQANQMVEMRSLMLAQANAQAAAQQAALDKDARQIASSQSLRNGLKVINTSANVASDAN
jgi:type IV secretion system protein TrbJ